MVTIAYLPGSKRFRDHREDKIYSPVPCDKGFSEPFSGDDRRTFSLRAEYRSHESPTSRGPEGMFGPAFGTFERRGGIKRSWQMLCVLRNRRAAVQVQRRSRPIILEIVGDVDMPTFFGITYFRSGKRIAETAAILLAGVTQYPNNGGAGRQKFTQLERRTEKIVGLSACAIASSDGVHSIGGA